jgi:hypothetical protein
MLCALSCRAAPAAHGLGAEQADAGARWVRAHASAMQSDAKALRACMGDSLPADPAHAPSLGLTVCECAAPLTRNAGFGACGRGSNFIALADSTYWAALVFSPDGPPALWPHGIEQVPFGQGLIYSTGADPLGGPWYILHLNPLVD